MYKHQTVYRINLRAGLSWFLLDSVHTSFLGSSHAYFSIPHYGCIQIIQMNPPHYVDWVWQNCTYSVDMINVHSNQIQALVQTAFQWLQVVDVISLSPVLVCVSATACLPHLVQIALFVCVIPIIIIKTCFVVCVRAHLYIGIQTNSISSRI